MKEARDKTRARKPKVDTGYTHDPDPSLLEKINMDADVTKLELGNLKRTLNIRTTRIQAHWKNKCGCRELFTKLTELKKQFPVCPPVETIDVSNP